LIEFNAISLSFFNSFDKKIALMAIKTYGANIQYISDNLKNDKEIILKACESHGGNIQFASDNMRNDKEIALKAVEFSS
jgi:hypothetical protein